MKKLLILMILFPIVAFGQTRPHWLQIQGKPVVSIKEYTSVTTSDDGSGLSAAIADATSKGQALDLGDDVFDSISTTIELPTGTHIINGNFEVTPFSGALITASGASDITIDGLSIDGNHAYMNSAFGLRFYDSNNITVRNVNFRNIHSATTSIIKAHFTSFTRCDDVTFTGNKLSECGRSGVYVVGPCKNIRITDNIIDTVENSGIMLTDPVDGYESASENVLISGNIIRNAHSGAYDSGTGTYGDQLYNQDGAIDVYRSGKNIVISNNIIEGFGIWGIDTQATPIGGTPKSQGNGIRVKQTEGATIVGNLLRGNDFEAALRGDGRGVTGSEGLVFSGNSVIIEASASGNKAGGCFRFADNVHAVGNTFISSTDGYLQKVGNLQDEVTFVNNRVEVLLDPDGGFSQGLAIRYNSDGVRIAGNYFENKSSPVNTHFMRFGDSTHTNLDFSGNSVIGFLRGINMQDSAQTFSDVKISGNTFRTSRSSVLLGGVATATNIIISDNHFKGAGGYGAIVLDTISEEASVTGVMITGNKFENIANGKLLEVTGANTSHVFIHGNKLKGGTGSVGKSVLIATGSSDIAVVNNFMSRSVAPTQDSPGANVLIENNILP